MTLPRTPLDTLLLGGVLVLAFQMLGPVLRIPLHIPINYNEGWNAVFDTRAVTPGIGPLYPPAGSLVFDNYPPLGFILVGALGRFVFGDMIVAGRVAALACLVATAALTGLCVRLLGGGRRAAVAAALLLLLYVNSYYTQYVAMDDPQWLAHAMMLGGLALLLRGGAADVVNRAGLPWRRVAAAALLMVAGGFVKHNLVALPLAATLWLVCLNTRAAAVWVAAALAGLAIGAGAIAALYGHAAFADILHHRRVFRVGLLQHSISRLAPLLALATIAAVRLRAAWSQTPPARPRLLFVALFGAIATVTGCLQRMGEGVYYNAHFETLVAVCLGFGLALPAVPGATRWRGLPVGASTLVFVASLPLIGAWPWHLPRAWAVIHDRMAQQQAWQPVIARIAAAHGPAGCLMMSLCWWAGKPSQVDVFNLTQSVLAGGTLADLQAAIDSRRFAIFQDDPRSFTHTDARRKLGHDPVMESFIGRYAPVGEGPEGIVLLAPIGGSQAAPAPTQ